VVKGGVEPTTFRFFQAHPQRRCGWLDEAC